MQKRFQRHHDIKMAANIGMVHYLNEWLEEQQPAESGYELEKDENQRILTVKVFGDMVFQNYDFLSNFEDKWKYKVKLDISGKLTVLDEL